MKSNHQCRLCGRWLEGEWNAARDLGEPERTEVRTALQRMMDAGRCDACPAERRRYVPPWLAKLHAERSR